MQVVSYIFEPNIKLLLHYILCDNVSHYLLCRLNAALEIKKRIIFIYLIRTEKNNNKKHKKLTSHSVSSGSSKELHVCWMRKHLCFYIVIEHYMFLITYAEES